MQQMSTALWTTIIKKLIEDASEDWEVILFLALKFYFQMPLPAFLSDFLKISDGPRRQNIYQLIKKRL